MSDPLENFLDWKASAVAWCIDACGLKPTEVPDKMWLQYYRNHMQAMEAGALVAKLIS